MKLSKHGCKNFGYHEAIGLGIGSYDFQQEDFQGAVILSVEEAKDIATLCGEAEFYAMQGENIKAKRYVGKARDLLVERIEQAEMSKQST